MGWFTKNIAKKNINWIDLTNISQLDEIKSESKELPVIILKHSTRCSISLMAKNRLDSNWDGRASEAIFFYLDLIKYRQISDQIAKEFKIPHESPQVLIIKNGKCSYSETHGNITPRKIANVL